MKRVRVVGNGIDDCPAARDAARRRDQNDTPMALYTGRFVERKGIRELIAAIPSVLAREPGTRFVLAGGHRLCSGEDMARYWLPPGFEPYRDCVHFTGWLSPDALARWYREADVLVVPSWYEPFGMVVIEGMLYGLPIATADVGGRVTAPAGARRGTGVHTAHLRTGLCRPRCCYLRHGQALTFP